MLSDWEFEIGSGAPVIHAHWSGLVDLRLHPERVHEISESTLVPALAPALLRINSPSSPVWTTKCDVWTPESFDPDELDAPPTQAACVLACYIDLLPRDPPAWSTPASLETFCRRLCALLSSNPARSCRADLIIRRALLAAESDSLGITAYLSACGPIPSHAASALATAISALADSLCPIHPPQIPSSS